MWGLTLFTREFITGQGVAPPHPPDACACVGGFSLGAAACFFCNFISRPVVWTSQGSFFAQWGRKCPHFVVGWICTG